MSEYNKQIIETERPSRQFVFFTDFDATLLDHETYSFEAAKPGLAKAKEQRMPIIPVTSKTLREVTDIENQMGIFRNAPFIIENGNATFIPEDFFDFDISTNVPQARIKKTDKFIVIEYGKTYEETRSVLKEAAEEARVQVKGIGDMTIEEFAKETGLSLDKASDGKERMHQEGFKIEAPVEVLSEAQERIKQSIEKRGYIFSFGGRFYQISGGGYKRIAVEDLIHLLHKKYPALVTVGLGDAQSDLEFLEACDQGYLVDNPKRAIDFKVESERIHRVQEVGPEGWNKIVLSMLEGKK